MVAIAIFSVVMVIVIGALLSLNDANKKAQALRAVVDNLNFAIEDMSRKLKTGKDFRCGDKILDSEECLDAGSDKIFLQFKPAGQGTGSAFYDHHIYYFDEDKGTIGHKIAIKGATSNMKDLGSIIAPEVKIKDLRFFISKNTGTNLSITTITMNGEFELSQFGGSEKFKTPFTIQTTVNQRADASF